MKKFHIDWDIIGANVITARHRSLASSQSVRFNVEVRSIGKDDVNLISFEFISGELQDCKAFFLLNFITN
jgi:hypothetical protein